MNTYNRKQQFKHGIRRGIPITIGYIPVSFAFGLFAVKNGLSPKLATFISLSNLTSAGQQAGTDLIIKGSTYLEITLTTFVINLRYMLMSLSLSQKLIDKVSIPERLLFSFGITDETYAVASAESGSLTPAYLYGLIIGPIIGWTLGTALGALICSALPTDMTTALGIALFGMFIAIFLPAAKKSRPILMIVIASALLSCLIKYLPILQFISKGFRVILVTLLVSLLGAYFFPINEKEIL